MNTVLLQSSRHEYSVAGDVLARTPTYRLYLATETTSNMQCIVQVASGIQHNGALQRAAYILDELAKASRTYDEAYSKTHSGKRLHYDRLFPVRLESFVPAEQGNRRVNVLAFMDVDAAFDLLPLSNLLVKNRRVLDLKTGAWVMGRLLKLLGFVHEQGIAVRSLRPNNLLLDTSQHYAIVLDWSTAQVFQEKTSRAAALGDIVNAAETVLACSGISEGSTRYQLNPGEAKYVQLLRRFAAGEEPSATAAHVQFYDLLREIWDTEFYPFTTLPR